MKNIIFITLFFISNLCTAQRDTDPTGYVNREKLIKTDEVYIDGDHIPDVILEHKTLKILEISDYIGKTLPDLGDFKQLKKLKISGLYFASIPTKSISEIDSLQEIRLNSVKTEIDISYFYSLKQLKVLE